MSISIPVYSISISRELFLLVVPIDRYGDFFRLRVFFLGGKSWGALGRSILRDRGTYPYKLKHGWIPKVDFFLKSQALAFLASIFIFLGRRFVFLGGWMERVLNLGFWEIFLFHTHDASRHQDDMITFLVGNTYKPLHLLPVCWVGGGRSNTILYIVHSGYVSKVWNLQKMPPKNSLMFFQIHPNI